MPHGRTNGGRQVTVGAISRLQSPKGYYLDLVMEEEGVWILTWLSA